LGDAGDRRTREFDGEEKDETSREKIVRLSHQITDVLVASDDWNCGHRDTIRQQVVLILTATLKGREKVSWKSAKDYIA